MLKMLQARLQHYRNRELPDVQAGFRKGRGTRDQIARDQIFHWIIEKAREFQKNIYLCFIDYAKVFDCVDCNKLWKTLKEMGIPDHLTCLLRNLYASQEATVRTLYGTTDSFSPAFHMTYSAYKLNRQATINSLVVLLSQFGTSQFFHVQFCCIS